MRYIIYLVIASTLVSMTAKAIPGDNPLGYDKTPTGLYYKIFKHGKGRKIAVGDMIVFYNATSTIKDSLLAPVQTDASTQVMAPQRKGDPNELFVMLNVGDSAALLISVDSAVRGNPIPAPFKAGDFFKVVIKIKKALTAAEYQAYNKHISDSTMAAHSKEIDDYLNTNKLKAQKTQSGLYYVIEQQGMGAQAASGKKVKVKYKGYLLNGTVFDPGTQPIDVELGKHQVIQGWEEGIALFKKGGKGKLIIPSNLGYGPQGAGAAIPPNSTLVFDIEVVDVAEPVSNDQEIQEYIAQNKLKAQKTPSGLYYVIDQPGTGAQAAAGKKVKVNYKGYLLDGTVFDASTQPGREPFEFTLGAHQVIAGWDEGIALFKVGGKGKLLLPSTLGYGANGAPPSIPGNAALIFEIEVLDVK